MASEQRMTVGEVFKRFRQMPEMRELVEACYLDEDLLQAAKRFHRSEEFQAVMEWVSCKGIREASQVLDLGGGSGVTSLAWKWAGHQVVLVEPDTSSVVGLGAIAPVIMQAEYNIGLCRAIGERLPFLHNTFDVVYTRQVLHHVSNLDAVCAEVYRILKPNGLLIATREHVISKPGDLDVFLRNHPVHRYTGAENARLLSEYRNALRRAGFRQVKVLRRWESVINYYPISRSGFASQCRHALCKRLGVRIGQYLAKKRVILRLCGWYCTVRDRTPGRLYSFLATR